MSANLFAGDSMPADAETRFDSLCRSDAAGDIAVCAGSPQFPRNASVSLSRTRSDSARRTIADGISRAHRANAASARSRLRAASSASDAPEPAVLAMYDVSIDAAGVEWQPADGDPVRVTVELAEPVAVAPGASLTLVHLSDDGAVEELPASRRGFVQSADGMFVTGFWFSATGFSIYAIVDSSGETVSPRRFYHFYSHPSAIDGTNAVQTLPYAYADQSNDVVNVQIVKTGDFLREPPVPDDIVDPETGDLVSVFEGWYVVHTETRAAGAPERKLDSETDPFVFVWPVGVTDLRLSVTNAVDVTETADTDYFVVPLFEHARFLQFNDGDLSASSGGASRIIDRKVFAMNDETGVARIKVSDISAARKNAAGAYFSGWTYSNSVDSVSNLLSYSDAGQPQEAWIDVDATLFSDVYKGDLVNLWPLYEDAHFLNFDTNAKGSGALYVGSIFVRSTSRFSSVTPSERNGYVFNGWCTGSVDKDGRVTLGSRVTDGTGAFIANLSVADADGIVISTDADGCVALGRDVTLFASWTARSSAPYRVVVWQQKLADRKDAADAEKTYNYVTHYTSGDFPANTAIGDAMVTRFSGTGADGASVSSRDLTSAAVQESLTGELFVGFHYSRHSSADATVASDGSTVVNVYFDRDLVTLDFYLYENGAWTLRDAMTGLYGQTFAANGYAWDASHWWYGEKSGNAASGTRTTFMDAFLPTEAGSVVSFYGKSPSSSGTTIEFYKEALDGSWVLANTVASSAVSFNISDKYAGFHAYEYSRNGGGWTPVGNYDESTRYYGSQVTNYKSLAIRFKRIRSPLEFMDGDNPEPVFDTGATIPFESSLAAYDLSPTDSRINWGSRDTSGYTFDGWFEDASLTVPFDFSQTMPAARKMVYAKWSPIKYRVVIDPNGGELQSGDSTWFYLERDEKIIEYSVTRNYRLDMHHGTFRYHHDAWDAKNDGHTSEYVGPELANNSRRAFYTEDEGEATDAVNLYSFEPDAYSFMGWYEVDADGNVANDPYNFNEPISRATTLRALWRRTGFYTLRYESIDPDGVLETQVILDPEDADGEGGYVDDGETTLARDPSNYDHAKWIWEGWQVIDVCNNIPLTNVRSPGDVYVVHAGHADYRDNVIHFRAVYSLRDAGASRHIPKVVDLVLDANEGGRLANAGELASTPGRSGYYLDGAADGRDGLGEGVWFAGQPNNFSVNLADYADNFVHADGYLLLGWDTNRSHGAGLPAFRANEKIGVDALGDAENVLYAVWEPQIYIDLVNESGDDIHGVTLAIPAWESGAIYRVPEVGGGFDIYAQEAFTNLEDGATTFTLPAGEHMRLVLPDGDDKFFSVSVSNGGAAGTKMTLGRVQPPRAGEEPEGDQVATAYPGETAYVSGTMHAGPAPVTVTFAKSSYPTTATVPVRYFIHGVEGTIEEITGDPSKWEVAPIAGMTLTSDPGDIARALRKNASEGVNARLAGGVRSEYGHTTIGIGAAAGGFDEYRSITMGDPEGGSFIRFDRERVEWSRYGVVWNPYAAAAVYVVFYKRIPVHVTIAKNMVGTDDDKARKFGFTAAVTPHSRTVRYTKTTTYRKTRTATRSRKLFWWGDWSVGQWSEYAVSGVVTNSLPTAVDAEADASLFAARAVESFSLGDGERHPVTVYFASSEEGAVDATSAEKYTEGAFGNNDATRTDVTTYTQRETFTVVYQYETVEVEESAADHIDLTAITGDPGNPHANHNGVADVPNRTYAFSSIGARRADGFYSYQPLDTAIFTNTRRNGELTISKTVLGAVAGDAGDAFHFTVTLGETALDHENYVPPAGVTLGPVGKVFSFSLADGGSVTLANLPAGATYTVEEAAHGRYVTRAPANASGTVAAGRTEVSFVNERKSDLAIVMKDRATVFNGGEQHGAEIAVVTGTGDVVETGDYTVTGLKAGHVLAVLHHVAAHGTAVGEYCGSFANARISVADSSGRDVTGEYAVTTSPGSLSIGTARIVVTITGNTAAVQYDGTEHFCEKYACEFARADTGEAFEDESIYVTVDPQYQSVVGTNVGKYWMHLAPEFVGVSLPDGYELERVVVARNGWLEITPAPALVAADAKTKLKGRPDPELTATVSGLFGGDTLDYVLMRDEGELAGVYTITAAGASIQGNYEVAFAPGALTIAQVGLIQRATGRSIPLSIDLTDDVLRSIGYDPSGECSPEEVSNFLNQVDANGLRRWENVRTGSATNRAPTIVRADEGDAGVALSLETNSETAVDLGYCVIHDLRRKVGGEWRSVAKRAVGPSASGHPLFDVDFSSPGGASGVSGLYSVATLLVPNDDRSVTNAIPSTNTIGVLCVMSSLTNTIVAVPWSSLDASNAEMRVSEAVLSKNIEDGDRLVYYPPDGDDFDAWTRCAETQSWGSSLTVSTRTREMRRRKSEDSMLPRGGAFWLVRGRPKDDSGNARPFYLVGEHLGRPYSQAIAPGTPSAPGKTLCANPMPEAVKINDLAFAGGDGAAAAPGDADTIEIPNGSGLPLVCHRENGRWGYSTRKKVGKAYRNVFQTDVDVPAGTGFWYIRRAESPLAITWKGWDAE